MVRRFNEANNEEAGEHWTPRDAVKLMAKLKLNVRAAAAGLPEITEIEPIEDLVDDEDLDEPVDGAGKEKEEVVA